MLSNLFQRRRPLDARVKNRIKTWQRHYMAAGCLNLDIAEYRRLLFLRFLVTSGRIGEE